MTTTTTSPAILSLYQTNNFRPDKCQPISRPNFFPPNFAPKQNPRLRISRKSAIFSKPVHWRPCCCIGDTGVNPETTNDSSKESSINIQLPRRSLLVQFNCNACGEKTKRLINRLAYERGTVFVQCSGCLQHHKLVDNLGLVVEYDFRNDSDEDRPHTKNSDDPA